MNTRTADGQDGPPKISVITPVLNGARTLEKCILSVVSQSYRQVEFIVIDGGSTDGSVDIISKHSSGIGHWRSEPDTGIYDALNKGIRLATGDWILVLGSDDCLASSDVLERLALLLVSCPPDIKLAYGSVAITDKETTLCVVSPTWTDAKARLRDSTPILGTGLMHRRRWFDLYGLYDTSFRIAGDYEMLLRGWPKEDALHLPQVVTVAVGARGISNISSAAFECLRELRRAQSMHAITPPLYSRCKNYVHAALRFVIQQVWDESAMWRIKQARERLSKPRTRPPSED